MRNAVEVNNLVKRYKELLALDHFSLAIKEMQTKIMIKYHYIPIRMGKMKKA